MTAWELVGKTNFAARVTSFTKGSVEDATVGISLNNIKVVHIHRAIHVTTTTEDDVAALNYK